MEPILTVRGMDKSFGATIALRQVDIDVYPRRNPRADRRKRQREIHADFHHRRHSEG